MSDLLRRLDEGGDLCREAAAEIRRLREPIRQGSVSAGVYAPAASKEPYWMNPAEQRAVCDWGESPEAVMKRTKRIKA